MQDKEKVIKGLETCSDVYYGADGACSSCPYSKINGDMCVAELVHDAISLLKEQEPEEPIRMHHTEHKQTDNYRCRKCGNDLYFEQRFCEACGTEVNWNE